MTRKEQVIKVRSLSLEEKNHRILELKKELFSLRFQKASGNLENASKIKQIKKEIARIKTIINEPIEAGEK